MPLGWSWKPGLWLAPGYNTQLPSAGDLGGLVGVLGTGKVGDGVAGMEVAAVV